VAKGCKAHCSNCGRPATITWRAEADEDDGFLARITSTTIECDHVAGCARAGQPFEKLGDWFDNEFAIAESIASGRNLRPLKVA
jgi:hypothetical protein